MKNYAEKKFLERNWRLTAAVRNVIDILAKAESFLSVVDIQEELNALGHPVDPVTVYRILKKMSDVSLIHEQEGRWIKCSDHENPKDHHFLICEMCGKSEEVFLDYRDTIADQLAREKKFLLKQVNLSFLGMCDKCLKKI